MPPIHIIGLNENIAVTPVVTYGRKTEELMLEWLNDDPGSIKSTRDLYLTVLNFDHITNSVKELTVLFVHGNQIIATSNDQVITDFDGNISTVEPGDKYEETPYFAIADFIGGEVIYIENTDAYRKKALVTVLANAKLSDIANMTPHALVDLSLLLKQEYP